MAPVRIGALGVSVQAVGWVLYGMTPEEADPTDRLILLVLADHAHPDGTRAFPAVSTIAAAVGVSDRTVQRRLAELLERGLIRLGDQGHVGHLRGGHRPVVYDLEGCQPVTSRAGRGVTDPGRGVTDPGLRGDMQSVTQTEEPKNIMRAGACPRCGQRVAHDDDGMTLPHSIPRGGLCHPPAPTRMIDTASIMGQVREHLAKASR